MLIFENMKLILRKTVVYLDHLCAVSVGHKMKKVATLLCIDKKEAENVN